MAAPFALTVPLRVAPLLVVLVAAPVVANGAPSVMVTVAEDGDPVVAAKFGLGLPRLTLKLVPARAPALVGT